MDQEKLDDALRRAQIISSRIRSGADLEAQQKITAYQEPLTWSRPALGISEQAWQHVQAITTRPS